jgi:hypothetical protein
MNGSKDLRRSHKQFVKESKPCRMPFGPTLSAWPQLAAGVGLVALMVGCGGGSSKPAITTTPSCAGASAAAVPAAKAHSLATPAQALSPITPQYFGMHIDVQALSGGNPPLPWPTTLTPILPFGTIRMNSTETRWSEIDKGNGNYDFATLDQWRTLYQQNEGANPAGDYQIIFTLYSVPKYISSNPTDGCNFSNTSGHQPGSCDPPADVCSDGTGTDQAFTDFVTALAQHVNGDSLPKIHYWEIWNEPNDITFWNGSLPQLARMAQDARCVIVGTDCNSLTSYTAKGIDPTSQMLTPPPVQSSDETKTSLNSPAGWMSAYLAAGGGQYADIIGFHGYVEPDNPAGVEGVFTVAQSIAPTATAAGVSSKPIWDTELGYSTTVVPDQNMQAGWLASAYLLQAGLGIQRVNWFEYGATNFGTLYVYGPPAGPNAAEVAYGVVYNWLVGATPAGPCASSGTIWTCDFTLSTSAQAQAVWDTSQTCTPCGYSNFSPSAEYIKFQDLQGNSHSISSGSSVQIGAQPILLESQ